MAQCGDFIKKQFPLIDDELKDYVEGMFQVIKVISIAFYCDGINS